MDIRLNLINRADRTDDCRIVIFHKNIVSGYSDRPVAWQVIDCGPGESRSFIYPASMQVSARDSDGNFMPHLDALPGDAFTVSLDSSGHVLSKSPHSASQATEVQVTNALTQGAISADIYGDGKLLATKSSIAPGQTHAFQFPPSIWIGAAAGAVEGQVMDLAAADAVDTEIELLGLASADIVITDGAGDATPPRFALEKEVYA